MVLGAVLVVGACGDSSKGPVARFDVPSTGPIEWGVAPFPNDLFVGDDGTVELASLPVASPMWEGVRDALGERRGFCGTCPIYFPIDGEIDPSSLVDGVVMIDPSGKQLALEAQWDATDTLIAVRAHRGIALTAGARYVVALTSSIRGSDGSPLRAASGFTSARAKMVTAPGLEALAAAGIPADSVVALAAFTVEDAAAFPRALGAQVRAYFAAHGEPIVTVEHVWRASDGTLDALMGVPAQDRPGGDVPSRPGDVGTTGVAHGSVALLVKGHFSSTRVITGSGTELGTLRPDVVAGDQVPFVLAIPAGANVSQLPVLVFHHGLSGTLSSGLGLADTACKAGVAFLSLETYQHGERAPGATDTVHAMRTDPGTLGPDGFFESVTLTLALRVLALSGTPGDQVASPRYLLGTLSQMVADLHGLLEVVHGSNLGPIAAADASLANLAFDRTKVYFTGGSLGTLVGTATLVGDSTVTAAVFNVPISGMVATLTENEAFRTQVELLMLSPMGIPNATYEPELSLSMHPLMGFMQWSLSQLEPAALVSTLVATPGRDLLWQLAGLDELAGVPAGNHLIGVAGVPAVGVFPYAAVATGTAPLQGRGAYLFPQADHFMALVNAGESKMKPPGLPPFETRSSVLMFANPTAAVHQQLTHFLQTKRLTGVAEIAAP